MAEGSYEYECMRAELLGKEMPNYDEFLKNKEILEREALEAAENRDLYEQQEDLKRAGGKLNELNNILKSTQKKLNNFTAPFSRFLKSKIGLSSNEQVVEFNNSTDEVNSRNKVEIDESFDEIKLNPTPIKNKMHESDLSLLDNLILKTENAQTSMEIQTKQMKKFLH